MTRTFQFLHSCLSIIWNMHIMNLLHCNLKSTYHALHSMLVMIILSTKAFTSSTAKHQESWLLFTIVHMSLHETWASFIYVTTSQLTSFTPVNINECFLYFWRLQALWNMTFNRNIIIVLVINIIKCYSFMTIAL